MIIGRDLGRTEVRHLYNCLVHSVAAEDVLQYYVNAAPNDVCLWARGMHQYRQHVRTYTRERGSWLDETAMRLRDVFKYGWARTSGPLFADLYYKHIARDSIMNETSICEHILESAQRTSAEWNKHVGVDRHGDDSCLTDEQRTRTKRVHRILFTTENAAGLSGLTAHYRVNNSDSTSTVMTPIRNGKTGEYECCQLKITARDTVSYSFSYTTKIEYVSTHTI
jgi:hypothetical protein